MTNSVTVRDKGLRLAISSAIVSKFFGLTVQLISVPIGLAALGVDVYGEFVVITASLAWVSMISLGAGPGLTRGLAVSVSNSDLDGEKKYFSSAVFSVFMIGLILVFIISLVSYFDFFEPLERILNSKLSLEYYIFFFLIMANVILGLAEGARAGYQEQHVTYIWSSIASVVTITSLCTVFLYPSIVTLMLSIYGVSTLFRGINFLQLLCQRNYLISSYKFLDIKTVKSVTYVGIAFFLVQISSFLVQQGIVLVVAVTSEKNELVVFSLFIKVITIMGGLVLIITQALWPAVTDANESKDYEWIVKEYKKKIKIVSSYALLVCLGIMIFGPDIIKYWGADKLDYVENYHYYFGPYFLAVIWSHFHYMVLIGMGVLWRSAAILLAEAVIMIAISYMVSKNFGSHLVPVVMLCTTITISCVLLSLTVFSKLSKGKLLEY